MCRKQWTMENGQWKMLGVKRSWVTWSFVCGVILLLTLFLGFQYNWLLQAGEAEREQIQKRVETDTRNFADDFNREIQAAFFNFQTDAKVWQDLDWTEFNERFDYWKSKTAYPELIREFTFVRSDPVEALRYNMGTKGFEPTPMTAELDAFRKRIEDEKTHKPIYDDEFVLVMPIHSDAHKIKQIVFTRSPEGETPKVQMPPKVGYLIIKLDRETVTARILPDLAKKHFPEGAFKIGVVDKDKKQVFQTSDEISTSDASAELLTLSPDSLMFFASKDILPRIEKRTSSVVDQHVESRTFSHSEVTNSSTSTFTIEMKKDAGEKRRTSMISGTTHAENGWKLSVQHSSGSVAAFITGERNRRMLMGVGIYLLIVGSILAIVISARRSQKFAQRQIDFVSSVSHEFRTPLAVIYSAGENLADGVTKEKEQITRYGNLIKGEGKKLTSMVEQILEFAGARSGRKKYSFTETDVAGVTKNALAECAPLLEDNDFEVETSIADSLPIEADADALSSAIQNLIQNSVKYSNGTRWLKVSTENGDGAIKIAVEDRGIGIAAGELTKIFEPFYRAKDVVEAQIHGNGLGLSLVKEIAEAHGGKVSAESEVGKGSRFTIELPWAEPPA